jgi:hypothetical protein
MKIIGVDNFDRDDRDEILVAENVPNHFVQDIVEMLNKKYCNSDYSPYFYKAVEDSHKLYIWEP